MLESDRLLPSSQASWCQLSTATVANETAQTADVILRTNVQLATRVNNILLWLRLASWFLSGVNRNACIQLRIVRGGAPLNYYTVNNQLQRRFLHHFCLERLSRSMFLPSCVCGYSSSKPYTNRRRTDCIHNVKNPRLIISSYVRDGTGFSLSGLVGNNLNAGLDGNIA